MICVHFYYITKRTTRSVSALADLSKKNHAARRGNFLTPPRKTAGRRCALPAKKPPDRATVSEFVPIWCAERESNPHAFWARHFKCLLSTNSNTRAYYHYTTGLANCHRKTSHAIWLV